MRLARDGRLPSVLSSSVRSAKPRKNSKVWRFSGLESAARMRSEASKFSHIRGGASAIVGPSSRKSRCTVCGLSGQLQVKPTTEARASENSESPIHAIGR